MGSTLPVGSPGIARLQAQPPRCRPVLLGPSGWDGLWPPLVLCPRARCDGDEPRHQPAGHPHFHSGHLTCTQSLEPVWVGESHGEQAVNNLCCCCYLTSTGSITLDKTGERNTLGPD